MVQPQTIFDKCKAGYDRTSGFDYIRISLSIAIVFFHTILVCYGPAYEENLAWHSILRIPLFLLLPLFFAVSGFLIAGSLDRSSTLSAFFTLRALRLFPGLLAQIFLCIFILGPALTSLPLSDYLSNSRTFLYALQPVGLSEPELPGIFLNNPLPTVVNRSLWTIPLEYLCYAVIGLLAISRYIKRPKALLIITSTALLMMPLGKFIKTGGLEFITPSGRLLVCAFLVGLTIYAFRDRTPFSWSLLIGSCIAYAVLAWRRETSWLSIVPAAYIAVFVGALNPPRLFFVRGRDYSFGVYIYSFPIQQTIAHLFPEYRVWWFNALVALPFTIAVAAMSWHFIEGPALRRKEQVMAWALKRPPKKPKPVPLSKHQITL